MKRVVGLGEVLWDILPGGPSLSLGGAPANFAYITTLLGDEGIIASRVGSDSLGRDALLRMRDLGLDTRGVQHNAGAPTGTARVELDGDGLPRYDFAQSVAWDFLEWTSEGEQLAATADAICFGSLAQRSDRSRATIRRFLDSASPSAVKVFDVNLRRPDYSSEILVESMKRAEIIKLNDEELPIVMELSGLPHRDAVSSARNLLEAYGSGLICVTRGGRGSLLIRDGEVSEHAGFQVKVADTVGSGDAFTAGLVHEYLRGATLDRMNDLANRAGAWVASEAGAMPIPGNEAKSIWPALAGIR